MTRAILIDDEPIARDTLRALLAAHPVVSIVGEAGTLATARSLLENADYDLVFLDIQLRGGTGFDLVPHVRAGARIIFVTAYDQHALRAFEVNALDYLLKPVAPARLAATLARHRPPPAESSALPLRPDDRLLLKLGAGTERFVRPSEIRLLTACENYSEVHLSAADRFLVRKTLASWETDLPKTLFARVHRTAIVNVAHVEGIERLTESSSQLSLDGGSMLVTASYRYLPALREVLARHQGG